MKVGQLVMLIGREDGCWPDWPPMGAVGTIETPLDKDGDHDVLFPDHIWSPQDPCWCVEPRWLMPLDGPGAASLAELVGVAA